MNYMDEKATIGGIVAAIPAAAMIFGEVGIDYCCGGHRLLLDVLREKGLAAQDIYEKLARAIEERKSGYDTQEKDFLAMSPAVLATYIEDTHHSFLRRALPEAAELLQTVLKVHGKNHQELFSVYRLFGQLKADLEQHLVKEETMLFPELGNVAADKAEIIRVTAELVSEHEAAGKILQELRVLTNNYTIPEGGCGTYQKAYQLLEEIENDIHQHIHLESNILLVEYTNHSVS
ncbi:MAG: iron-sulfur cluster repair di-iron protein [Clostridia bacterium]